MGKTPEHHRFDLVAPKDPLVEIERVIGEHKGELSAICIEAIALEVWPYDWSCCVAGPGGFPIYPHRANIQRVIKEAVRALRRKAKKIGSSRGARSGYYMIVTAQELEKTVRPLIHQALDELETAEILASRPFARSDVAGQFSLFKADIDREQGTGNRE